MIINALCNYYDILAEDEKSGISPYGYQKTDFYYDIILTENGELSSIYCHISDKKKDKPKTAIIPKDMKKPGIAASPVCDNMTYIFGVDGKKGDNKTDMRKFNAAKELHLRLFSDAVSKEAVAVKRFFEKWNVDTAWENEAILTAASETGNAFSGNAVFKFSLEKKYFHDCEEIKNIWLEENKARAADEGAYIAQCAVTGEIAPIARLHTQLSGVKGALATGASLVCFKKDADQSYNLSQSYNSRVSETAEFKYTTALQHLLKSKTNKLYIGDDTVVFWAYSKNKKDNLYEYENEIFEWLGGNAAEKEDVENFEATTTVDAGAEESIKTNLEQSIKGIPGHPDVSPEVKFYVLGLAPNAGRISVRYFYSGTFLDFYNKVERYEKETEICGMNSRTKIGSIIHSTVSSKSRDKKPNPLLGGALMRALLSGNDYPRLLFNQVILRIKAEANITQSRAAAVKAYLIRNKNEKEEILPVLNEESKNPAYVLGRMFAILEKIQKDASGGKLNSTIKDKYFATACSNPALVFPSLLKLAQHHLSKIDGNYLNIKLQECFTLVEGERFPKVQNMEAQGSFILGYYQQNAKLYETKENEIKNGEKKDKQFSLNF